MRAILVVLVAAAAGVAVFWDGGFASTPQWTFAALSGAAVLAAALTDPGRASRLLRSPPVVVIGAIGALQALSAAWTIDTPAAALRSGAVTASYAALILATCVGAQRTVRVAGVIAAAVVVTGAMGLASAALFSTTYAERIEGAWRPEGPFGYPPALALVQVFGLPFLLGLMGRARPIAAGVAASAAAIAAGVLVLDANRVSVGLAALVAGIALVAPEQTVGTRRIVVVVAVGLLAVCGALFHQDLGGFTPSYAPTGAGHFVWLIGIVVLAGVAWVLARPWLERGPADKRLRQRALLASAAAALVAAIAAGLFSSGALSARRFPSHQGFTHGRSWMWSAAFHTAVGRPFYGYGAGAFYRATVSRQPGHGRVTRFAHDLPLELAVETGIAGFLLGIALYVVAARSLWRARGLPELWLLGPAIAAFLLSNLVDWSWHLAGAGALFALARGGLFNALRPAPRP